MSDQRYNYENTIAVKLLVKKDDKIFLIKEPETNDWMPGKLSLPGGKLLLGESIEDGLKRKIKTEIGFEIEILGLIKVLNILMPNKNVYHFIFLAEWKDGEIELAEIEAKNADWYSAQKLMSFSKDDYAEYYTDELLKEAISNRISPIPISIIQLQDNRTDDIIDWMKKGMPDGKF